MKKTTIFLADEDVAAVHTIQMRHGLCSLSDAIRFSLRLVAASKLQISIPEEPQNEQEGEPTGSP